MILQGGCRSERPIVIPHHQFPSAFRPIDLPRPARLPEEPPGPLPALSIRRRFFTNEQEQ